jgi:DNA-binding YbaB/EbfC family protein
MMRNLGGMMKKVQEMQSRMEEMQAELEIKHFSASIGSAVSATVTGKGRLVSLKISSDAADPSDTETLEDLVCSVVNKALEDADAAKSAAMSDLTGGLPLPPGMKLPF